MEEVSGEISFESLNFVLFATISIWLLIGLINDAYWVIKQDFDTHLILGILNALIVLFIV